MTIIDRWSVGSYEAKANAAAKIVSDKLGCTVGVHYDPTYHAWVFTVEGYTDPAMVQHHVSDADTVELLTQHLETAVRYTLNN